MDNIIVAFLTVFDVVMNFATFGFWGRWQGGKSSGVTKAQKNKIHWTRRKL